jgi:GTPase involved in cell partitioning and DNA repair
MFKSKTITGNNGRAGGGKGCFGKDGGDLKISIPIGTLVSEVLNET